MITTIYLVKKNPNKPNSEDNWLMMSIAEFNEFVKTPEAKGRYFADLGAHEYSDISLSSAASRIITNPSTTTFATTSHY